jgi:hypothetical protein
MTRYVSLHKFALKYFPHGAISSPFGGCATRSGAFRLRSLHVKGRESSCSTRRSGR